MCVMVVVFGFSQELPGNHAPKPFCFSCEMIF